MFRKMPVIIVLVILFIALIEPYIPIQYKSFVYALSLTIKSVIIFVLPVVIFMLLFKTIAQLTFRATKVILYVLIAICCSNFISTMISYNVGSALYYFDLSLALPQNGAGLEPLWILNFPKLIANDYAMASGILLGIVFSFFNPPLAEKLSGIFEKIVGYILHLIICVIPIFIAGFVVKLINDKVMENIINNYFFIFLLVAIAQFSYITLIYLVSSQFKLSSCIRSIRNMLPAALAGFGSMSSAAAMPLTIVGTEKNSNDPNLTRLLIPTTVNIHLIGDCFAIPIFAFAVLRNFDIVEPTWIIYLQFAFYFVMAKFSVAAIPGGGIIVMLPILESHFGFNAEMVSLITALYILFDPVITCANVLGNGGFALAISKMQSMVKNKRKAESFS